MNDARNSKTHSTRILNWRHTRRFSPWALVTFLLAANLFTATVVVASASWYQAELNKANERIGACVDMAAESRAAALLAEESWWRVVHDLESCELWEPRLERACLGPEYYSSFNPHTGP
jgi:hypothetical protein